jgi:hypothetical protein
MSLIKKLFFLYCFLHTNESFGKSDEYYRMTLIYLLTNSECNTECKKIILEQEIKVLFIEIFEKLLKQIQLELLEERGKIDTIL